MCTRKKINMSCQRKRSKSELFQFNFKLFFAAYFVFQRKNQCFHLDEINMKLKTVSSFVNFCIFFLLLKSVFSLNHRVIDIMKITTKTYESHAFTKIRIESKINPSSKTLSNADPIYKFSTKQILLFLIPHL